MTSHPRQVLVSACLLGRECRYDGRHNHDRALEDELRARGEQAVPFCPEEAGGLPTPRPAAWIEAVGAEAVLDGADRLITAQDEDVTEAFLLGASLAAEECRTHQITRAYLKERSPSCGVCCTHVGGQAVEGPGVTAARLARQGVEVIGIEGRRSSKT
jgi:uncharacterized protein YbbK (DUF523 family)